MDQERFFQEGGDGDWQVLKDNPLWEKEETSMEPSKHTMVETELTADGTLEKGLGPAYLLVQAVNLYKFQPLTIKILEKEENKAEWQDRYPEIRIPKSWLKDNKQPARMEMNFKTPEVLAYRKVLSTLRLKQVEGTVKTILVKKKKQSKEDKSGKDKPPSFPVRRETSEDKQKKELCKSFRSGLCRI